MSKSLDAWYVIQDEKIAINTTAINTTLEEKATEQLFGQLCLIAFFFCVCCWFFISNVYSTPSTLLECDRNYEQPLCMQPSIHIDAISRLQE